MIVAGRASAAVTTECVVVAGWLCLLSAAPPRLALPGGLCGAGVDARCGRHLDRLVPRGRVRLRVCCKAWHLAVHLLRLCLFSVVREAGRDAGEVRAAGRQAVDPGTQPCWCSVATARQATARGVPPAGVRQLQASEHRRMERVERHPGLSRRRTVCRATADGLWHQR